MGSGASSFSFWTAGEAERNEASILSQKLASEFLIKYLFYGVPVRKVKKSADPKSPLWIEVHPDVLGNVLGKKSEEYAAFDEQLLRSLPTGVVIDGRGNIKVVFTLFTSKEISYEFTVQDLVNAQQAHDFHSFGRFKTYSIPQPYSNKFTLRHEVNLYHVAPQPLPPAVIKCTHDAITLSILESLPQPPGIVQQVEIQYSLVSTGATSVPLGSTHAISSIASRAHKRRFVLEYIEEQQQLLLEQEAREKERIETQIRLFHHHKAENDRKADIERQKLLLQRERDRGASAGAVAAKRRAEALMDDKSDRRSRSDRGDDANNSADSKSKGGKGGVVGNDNGEEHSPVLISQRRSLANAAEAAETFGGQTEPEDFSHNSNQASDSPNANWWRESVDGTSSSFVGATTAAPAAPSPFLWHGLCTRSYELPDFSTYNFERLLSGQGYIFRIRYRNHLAYSPYSLPTPLVCTRAAPPSIPEVPILGTVTSTSVMLFWQPPSRDNGRSITHYVLRARSVGSEWVTLYTGPGLSFVASELYPDFAYSFQVAAANSMGQSEFSESLSTQTPPRVRLEQDILAGLPFLAGGAICNPLSPQYAAAMRCAMAWRELWDPGSEQTFYYNRITSVRQLERPVCLGMAAGEGDDPESAGASLAAAPLSAVERAMQRDKAFRKKRYQLLRSLYKDKGTRASNYQQESTSTSAGGSPGKAVTLLVSLSRTTLLSDAFAKLAPPAMPQRAPDLVNKRLRFAFIGEEGIDSGGISKEAFLLLSQACARYLGGGFRCLLRELQDCSSRLTLGASDGGAALPASAPTKSISRLFSSSSSKKLLGLGGLGGGSSSSSSDKKKSSGKRAGTEQEQEAEELQEEQRYATTMKREQEEEETAAGRGGAFPNEGKDGDIVGRNLAKAKRLRERSTSSAPAPAPGSDYSAPVTDTDEQSISEKTERLLDAVPADTLAFFFGRLLGKAVADRQLVDARISGLLLAHMTGENQGGAVGGGGELETSNDNATATANALLQVQQLDPELYKSLRWMQDNDITGVLDLTFSVSVEGEVGAGAGGEGTKGVVRELALCPDGLNKPVTEENKVEYIALLAQWKSRYAVQPLLDPFLRGFHELVPLDALRAAGITALELGLLLSGKETIDVDDLRPYVVYQSVTLSDAELAAGATPFGEQHEQVVWFWQCLRDMNQLQLRSLLRFFTGSSRIPMDGFDPPLALTQGVDMAADSLPRAHTCFNQLVLPPFSRISVMRERLVFAADNALSFDLS